MTRSILLVDGKNMLYRAAAGSGWLQGRAERGAHAYAFARALLRAVAVCKPCLPVVVWEGETNWRKALYPEYKAHREKRDPHSEEAAEALAQRDLMHADMAIIQSMLCHLGAQQAAPLDGEADDGLATLAKHFSSKGRAVSIWTGDHDLLQCVSATDRVRVLVPAKEQSHVVYDTDFTVLARLGAVPKAVPDLIALEGDPSDNIPGVYGIGPVAAKRILEAHKTLGSAILAAEMFVRGHKVMWAGNQKQAEALAKMAPVARTFRELAALRLDAEMVWRRPMLDSRHAVAAMHKLDVGVLARQGTLHEFREAFAVARST